MSPVLIVVALAAVAGAIFMLRTMRPDLAGAEARRLVAEGAKLVDVRTPGEFAAGHIPGAINIPLHELPRRLADLGAEHGTIILYCASGARSGQAKRILHAKGYSNAKNLGPMSAW